MAPEVMEKRWTPRQSTKRLTQRRQMAAVPCDSPHADGVPSIILNDVEDFSIQQSQPLPDTNLKKVKQQRL
jgi:hypothetical protein